jgi:UDP:flavonoid glycosyltransferase YjiC (YdhE family)
VVVLPVAYDQPGVGVRVEWSGVGRSIPLGQLTVARLRDVVRTVLTDPTFHERANQLRPKFHAADGLNRAAGVIESSLFGRTVPQESAPSLVRL